VVFNRLKQSRARREQERQQQEREARTLQLGYVARQSWEAADAARLANATTNVPGVMLKKDEVVYGTIDGAALIEPRRAPGQWSGGSRGVSFRVAKGVTYRVGASKGTYVLGEERPTPTDIGRFVVTNQRALFIGHKKSTEWAWSKLLGFSLEGEALAIFNVSNRQKATGVLYSPEVEPVFDALIAAAIAQFQGPESYAALVAELNEDWRFAHTAWEQSQQPEGLPPPAGQQPYALPPPSS
jgi:hypothetical protein